MVVMMKTKRKNKMMVMVMAVMMVVWKLMVMIMKSRGVTKDRKWNASEVIKHSSVRRGHHLSIRLLH